MSSALEVDYYRIRTQANSNRKMQHDPRTQKPFEENEALHVSDGVAKSYIQNETCL